MRPRRRRVAHTMRSQSGPGRVRAGRRLPGQRCDHRARWWTDRSL